MSPDVNLAERLLRQAKQWLDIANYHNVSQSAVFQRCAQDVMKIVHIEMTKERTMSSTAGLDMADKHRGASSQSVGKSATDTLPDHVEAAISETQARLESLAAEHEKLCMKADRVKEEINTKQEQLDRLHRMREIIHAQKAERTTPGGIGATTAVWGSKVP